MKRRFLSLTLLLCLLLPLLPQDSQAAIATDTITIRVGYVGGPYYEKATFHWKELDGLYDGALTTQTRFYSYCSGSRTAMCVARGFFLTDLLDLAGVDITGTVELAFWTDDQAVGAWTSFQKEELLDRPRYYYPNLSADEDGNLLPRNGGELDEGAQQVECMLALEENWEWDADSRIFEETGENFMSATGRFRLLFGQAYPSEARTMQAAKYVHTIDVTFAGKPVFAAESNLDLKIGQDFRVQVNVAAADSLLEEYIQENLVWSSNNTEVVEVGLYGNLVVKSEGEATITATYGEEAVSITVRVSPEAGTEETGGTGDAEKPPESGEPPTEEPPGENADEAAEPEQPPSETEPEQEPKQPPAEETEPVAYSENNAGVYILSSELMEETRYAEWVNSVLEHSVAKDSDTGDVMNWREEAMAEDVVQLVLEETPETSYTLPVALCTGGIWLLGGLWGCLVYFFHKKGKRNESNR